MPLKGMKMKAEETRKALMQEIFAAIRGHDPLN